MKHVIDITELTTKRRGALLPAIAFALVVVGAIAALVLNRLWLDATTADLQNAAEAAALAAAGDYLGDDMLKDHLDQQSLLLHAKQRAADVAAHNMVAGQPMILSIEGDDPDIAFGKRLYSDVDGESIFTFTDNNPDAVQVRARRMRETGNPIRLFFAGVTRQSTGERIQYAEARFDNLIDHFSAAPYRPVPAYPMAILESDPSEKRFDTWEYLIEQRNGPDQFSFDELTHQVVEQPDGIPEIELHSAPLNSNPTNANVQLLDFHNDLMESKIIPQIHDGMTVKDLQPWNNQLPTYRSIDVAGMGTITTDVQLALETQIGQQKLCLLYQQAVEQSVPGWTSLSCYGVVAIRILKVIPESGESATIIAQPTVLSTRSAVLAAFMTEEDLKLAPGQQPEKRMYHPNPYVYNIFVQR